MKKKGMKKKEENIKMPASKKKLEQTGKKEKPEKRKARKRPNNKKKKDGIRKILYFLMIFVMIGIAVYVLIAKFPLNNIEVSGNETYTTKEVQKAVKKNKYAKNTLLFYMMQRQKKDTFLPFVQKATVKIKNSTTISVKISEKKRIGKIVNGGYNWYYDRKGILLEKTTKDYDDVVTVEGLTYNEMKLNEEIPVKDSAYFDILLTISQSISKYGTPISKIWIRSADDIQLITDNFIIKLGDSDNLERKMEELYPALKSAKEQDLQGTIDMQYFTEDDPRIIFY